jgi:hypothetical protein
MFQNMIEVIVLMYVFEHLHVLDKILVELNLEMFLLLYYYQKVYNEKNNHLEYLNLYLMIQANRIEINFFFYKKEERRFDFHT